jgi:ABC-type antimicrobial peptide transport system ATPase subunit
MARERAGDAEDEPAVMEPLEQVTVLMTLMKRLGQVMEHERAILRSMRLDILPDIQEEKVALAEAYEIELARLRCSPEVLASLDAPVRSQLHEAMRAFQACVAANINALLAAQAVVEKVLRNIRDSLTQADVGPAERARRSIAEPRGEVITVAFDRKR